MELIQENESLPDGMEKDQTFELSREYHTSSNGIGRVG